MRGSGHIASPGNTGLDLSNDQNSADDMMTRLKSLRQTISRSARADIPGEVLLEVLFESTSDYVFVKNLEGTYLAANSAMINETRYFQGENVVGSTDYELWPEDIARKICDTDRMLIAEGKPQFDLQNKLTLPDGNTRWFNVSTIPLHSNEGEPTGIVGIVRDITERKLTEEFQAGQKKLLEMIAMNMPVEDILDGVKSLLEGQLQDIFAGFLILDETRTRLSLGKTRRIDSEFRQFAKKLIVDWSSTIPGRAALTGKPVVVPDLTDVELGQTNMEVVSRLGLRSCWAYPITSPEGEVLGALGVYSKAARKPDERVLEMTEGVACLVGIALERKNAEERIYRLAHHDTLTGVLNRSSLDEKLADAFKAADQNKSGVLVALVDLDNFKTVNDSFGHSAGDEALKIVAYNLETKITGQNATFRMGGDEFLVMIEDDQPSCANAWKMLKALHPRLAKKASGEAPGYPLTCSIGAAAYPGDADNIKSLLACADAALYRAKENGRNDCERYAPEIRYSSVTRQQQKDELHQALEKGEFKLEYQPQIDLKTGRICGMEAFARWYHPTRGLIAPAKFIPAAEEMGLMRCLGNWVVEEACRQTRLWLDAGLPATVIAVNISPMQFRQPDLVEIVTAALGDSRIPPSLLEMEITEDAIMRDLPNAVDKMRRLTALGVRIAIDDFGTGYSSLGALKDYPVSRLKIDHSFVAKLADDQRDAAIASSIISMALKLGFDVVAEGVETLEQVKFLREAQCTAIQGYLVSRPVTPDKMASVMSALTADPKNFLQC